MISMRSRCQRLTHPIYREQVERRQQQDKQGRSGGEGKARERSRDEKIGGGGGGGRKKNREAVTRVRDSSHGISHNARSLRCTGCSSGTDRAPPSPRSCSLSWSASPSLYPSCRSRSSVLYIVVGGYSRLPDLYTAFSHNRLDKEKEKAGIHAYEYTCRGEETNRCTNFLKKKKTIIYLIAYIIIYMYDYIQ